MLFPELPDSAKKALVFYFALEGDASGFEHLVCADCLVEESSPENIDWEVFISHADQVWAQRRYTLRYLSASEAKDFVMLHSPDLAGSFASFDSYHADYVTGYVPNHPDASWPVLAAPSVGEALLDGWHRLHGYIRDKHEIIPFLMLDEN